MLISLAGRGALITGASDGLGRAMAERFASSGAAPAMVARMAARLEVAAEAARAEEFAALACFPSSDEGGYVTGTAINVDGGRCAVV